MIALVVAVFAVPASAETIEVRGDVVELTATQASVIVWDAYNFGAFWYDLDDDLMTEALTIAATDPYGNPTLTGPSMDRTIDRNCLMYQTIPIYQEYRIYSCEGLTVDEDDSYYLEGWIGEPYVAIGGRADKLCELLVEFEDDDKKTLAAGEAWDIGGGFSLTAYQIDLEGNKVWFYLSKDGSELDNEVVSGGDVYTYTADIGGENDVPVFSCYVYATFRGTDSNLVQIKYVFLIDDDVLDIDCGDEYGVMEVMTASASQVILENDETTINLDTGTVEHIMGDMYFKIADDDTAIRFYPFVEYTDPGMYEIRGAVQNFVDMQSTDITWNAYNFGAFWYDLDDDLVTETLTIATDTLDAPWDRTIDANNLVYNTTATDVDFDYSGWGEYKVIGFMAEEYFAGYDYETDDITDDTISLLSKNILTRVLIDEDNNHMISTGASLELKEGYELKVIQLDANGTKAQLELLHDGKSVDTGIINAPDTYVYTKDIGTLDDVPIIAIRVDSVFSGTETDMLVIEGIFQISEDYKSVKNGDRYGEMEITSTTSTELKMKNDDDIDLDKGGKAMIMGNMYFKTADDTSAIRFYPFVERTIGGGVVPPEPTPTPPDTISSADADGDGVPDAWDVDNSTPSGYWVNSDGIGRRWGDMNGDGELTSVDALMILQAAVWNIELIPTENATLRPPKPIYLDNYAFTPKNPTIRMGEALNWINLQKSPMINYVLVSEDGLWENQTISYGKKFKYTFNTSGSYTYYCPGYGSAMRGTVTVLE